MHARGAANPVSKTNRLKPDCFISNTSPVACGEICELDGPGRPEREVEEEEEEDEGEGEAGKKKLMELR